MCVSPISIRNPRIDYRHGIDNLFILAPCGNCPECRSSKRADWFVRLYYEMQSHKKGSVLFPTFTFNSDSIPTINLQDKEYSVLDKYHKRPDVKLHSFDKLTLRNAIKKLRTRIDRLGLDCDFKYFIVCEYGSSDDASHRPHYHALFFFDDIVDENTFKSYFEYCWSYEVDKSTVPDRWIKLADTWYKSKRCSSDLFIPYGTKQDQNYLYCSNRDKYGKIHYFKRRGFVSYSALHGASVKDSSALNYITKYIFKPSSYFDMPNVKEYVDWLSYLPSSDKISDPDEKKIIERVKSVLPFTLSSNHLGYALYEDLQLKAELSITHDNIVRNNLVPNQIEIEQQLYKIPTYITNYLFYDSRNIDRLEIDNRGLYPIIDVNTTKKRLYTELGKTVLTKRFEFKVDQMTKSFRVYSSKSFIDLLRSHISTKDQLDKFNFIQNCYSDLSSIDFNLVAYYKICYQNVSKSLFDGFNYFGADKSFYIDFAKEFYAYKIHTYNDLSEFFSAPCKNQRFVDYTLMKVGLCNEIPLFDGFDNFLTYIDNVKSLVHELRSLERERKENVLGAELNNFFKKLNYGF